MFNRILNLSPEASDWGGGDRRRGADRRLVNEINRLHAQVERQVRHMNQLAKIGVALSGTRDLDLLLEMIVDEAQAFAHADGATLYLVTPERDAIRFTIAYNHKLQLRTGGATGAPVTFPPIPLQIDGQPNRNNVSAFVANTGELIDIPDVYQSTAFNFEGTKKFDAAFDYLTRSMLTIPMRDHEGDTIGVLQLINARDADRDDLIAFSDETRDLSASLASQAAVAITNARLIKDLQNLFDSFIQAIAAAIDEKSPYTGGHISRVANLTMAIAGRIDATGEGRFAGTHFNSDELYELRLAAWLHDTGKITTPEYVIDKHTKLETIFDRMELVRLRFELLKAEVALKMLNAQPSLATAGDNGNFDDDSNGALPPELIAEQMRLDEEFKFVASCNATQEFVPDTTIDHLKALAAQTVTTGQGSEPILTPDELYNLSIRKGNLTVEERKVIENHALMTIKILERLPFPRKIKNVPYIAGAHHEKLNGKGYPLGQSGDQINLQARIMALADIFEALTAKDRPYKQPKKMSEVLKILNFMVKDQELDPDVVQFFIDQKMHVEYAREHLGPEQLDVE
ncbi:MAG: GAF domain-containing protein [Calditrichaeota bacterium]|nr:GAF domain-containing protein [Calditrichota bacterium]